MRDAPNEDVEAAIASPQRLQRPKLVCPDRPEPVERIAGRRADGHEPRPVRPTGIPITVGTSGPRTR